MVLHSWISDWRRQTTQFLRLIENNYQCKRHNSEIQTGIEVLEERCVLAVVDLAGLGTAGNTLYGADAGDQSGHSVSGAGDVNGDGYDDLFIGAFSANGSADDQTYAGKSYVVFGGPSMPSTIDLANLGSAGITIFGANANDLSGSSVACAGDINGDGFDDLIIGAPAASGPDGTNINAGATYVIFGGAALPSTINLGSLGSAGITIFGADAYDSSGNSVSSAGDVNGDGFADLLIGAYNGDGAGNLKQNCGETYVIFGGATLPATINLSSLGSAGLTIFGADAYDQSGSAVSSAGDMNGDGFDDLVIGASSSAGAYNTNYGAGESYVIFGGPTLPASIDLSALGSAGTTIYGSDPDDQSGISVSSAGDINGDGLDDLIIGASKADGLNNAKNGSGESYIVFGATSLPASINLGSLNSAGITIYGADAADFSGTSVASAGDVNNDGYNDFFIGSGRDEEHGDARISTGWSYVIFGGPALPNTIDLASLDTAGITINGVDLGDRSGQSVSGVGDVNGDGFDDLIIGALGGDGDGNTQVAAGESYVLYGNGNHHPVFTSAPALNVAENQTAITTIVATDVDAGQTVTYSISGGADQSKFAITSDGVLSFVSPPDFENPTDAGADNTYFVQITANDGNGGLTNQNFGISVTDVNEAPVITSLTTFNVTEHTTSVETIASADPDFPAQTITYSISGGPDQAKFSITSAGVLSFIAGPDFQSPTDAGADNVYNLQVTASDGSGGLTSQNIAVTVNSANSHVPVFTSPASLFAPENTTFAETATANDADPGQTVHYSISGGPDRTRFTITSGGLLAFITAPDFENPTDVGTNNTYNVEITADDGNGGQTIQQIAVTVTNVDDAFILALGGPTATWTNKHAPVAVTPLVTIGGGTALYGATLTISVNASGTMRRMSDQFAIPSAAALGSSTGAIYSNGRLTLQIHLNSGVSSSAIQAFLRGITFATRSGGLRVATRTYDITLANTGVPTVTVRQTINVNRT
jgi:hypothetical protein